jgi:hypothetical protein
LQVLLDPEDYGFLSIRCLILIFGLEAERVVRILEVPDRYLPSGMGELEMLEGTWCARTVAFAAAWFYGERDVARRRGIYGDAWEIARHVRAAGGQTRFLGEAEALSAAPGEIIGFHYSLSLYNDDVDHDRPGRQPNHAGYTHVALVIAVDPLLGPIIVHRWKDPLDEERWPVRVEPLAALLAEHGDLFSPREMMTPWRLAFANYRFR